MSRIGYKPQKEGVKSKRIPWRRRPPPVVAATLWPSGWGEISFAVSRDIKSFWQKDLKNRRVAGA